MASKMVNLALVMVLVTFLWARTMAQNSCTNVLISMSPCLNYVTGSSSTPSSSCCSQLAGVVQRQPQCLCVALNGGGAGLGISINRTLALALPGACNVKTPPVSRCNGGTSGTDSPVGSPEALAGGSSSIVMKMPSSLVILVLIMATTYVSTLSSNF
ncbi:hypothetical protein UlMin_009244 [Ulmus minor]